MSDKVLKNLLSLVVTVGTVWFTGLLPWILRILLVTTGGISVLASL